MLTHRALAIPTAVLALVLGGFIGKATAQPPRMSAGLTYMLGFFQLRIVAGRIAVSGEKSFQTHQGEFKTNDRHERLELTQAGPSTTFHYELNTPQAQLTWDLLAGSEVRIRRLPHGNDKDTGDREIGEKEIGEKEIGEKEIGEKEIGEKETDAPGGAAGDSHSKLAIFSQPAEGPLSFSLGEGQGRTELRGATIWHLFLADPEMCGKELAPLLEIMKPGWDLARQAEALETLLFRTVEIERQPAREGWRRLVSDLGDARFSRRQAAERRLRQWGPDALPLLLSLDQDRLDTEQRFRVRSVIRSLTVRPGDESVNDDEPSDSIVRLLREQPIVWFGYLASGDEAKRTIAAAQLSRLLNRSIVFDPTADPIERNRQIDALRSRISSP